MYLSKYRKTGLLITSVIHAIFLSCQFLAEKPKNITLVTKGLTVKKDYLTVDNMQSFENEFIIGSGLNYVLEGVSGLSIKDDKVFMGCSMIVADESDGKKILNYDDLFNSENGYDKKDAETLNLSLSIGSPMRIGRTYKWSLKLWDKHGKGELTAEMKFKVSRGEDLVGIKSRRQGLTAKNIYVISNGSLQSTDVKLGQKLTMCVTGIKGYEANPDSTVSIGASMVVRAKDGTNIMDYTDLFQDYESIPLQNSETVSVYVVTGDPFKEGETYDWKIRVWDKNSKKFIESSLTLNVVK